MINEIDVIRGYFAKLKLEPEIADLYLALNTYGPQTISELSRNSLVDRTRIYRLLDVLSSYGLCETEIHYKRSILRPAPIGNLKILLSRREQELRDLRAEFSEIENILHNSTSMTSPATKIQFYQGESGLKQMLWNETRSNTEILSILYENIQKRTKSVFFERWVSKYNELGLKSRSIVGDDFLASLEVWYSTHQNERMNDWQGRYVPKSAFNITHSSVVYNDVTCYFNWKDGEIFGIEIYNQQLADTQRFFIESLWSQCEPLSKQQSQPYLFF